VIGRRQIEMYSRLIHTVDHVEGYLREGFDALDAFLCHMWAVTVTGAPKLWAMRFVEKMERSHRAWYGGAIGFAGFDGRINTGLTLRTVHVQDGAAAVRAGATLLYDSTPAAEEAETELKASAMRDALREANEAAGKCAKARDATQPAPAKKVAAAAPCRIILVDHQDSFVHTLANYLKQTGAEVTTVRFGFPASLLDERKPDLVVLSPGPGNPRDFGCSQLIGHLLKRNIPVFGVCLGLQAIVEHFGGELGVLPHPQHGKPASVAVARSEGVRKKGSGGGGMSNVLFEGVPDTFQVARYHSLYSLKEKHPKELRATASTVSDGVIMAIEHESLPLSAVQFHPESILTSPEHGMRILSNVVSSVLKKRETNGTTA